MATSFAVVVTNYNYMRFVQVAVDSALAQTRPAQRIIIVDDGSTDGSADFLRQTYGQTPSVELIVVPNGGQLSAFIHGVARVDTDVVCFLDADDEWKPDYLEKIGALYDARRDIDFIFTDVAFFGDESGRDAFGTRAEDLGYTAISTYVNMPWYGAPTSALSLRTRWARQALDLPADFVPRWRICADNCLVHGASMLGARKYFLPTGSVRYRVHGKNGWRGKETPASYYRHRLNARCLINHYAARIGFDQNCVWLAHAEFLTKPDPSEGERRRYARLSRPKPGARLKPSWWLKRLERYWRQTRRAWWAKWDGTGKS